MILIHKIFPTPLLHFKFENHHKYFFDEVDKSVKKPDNWEIPLNTSFPNVQDNDTLINLETQKKLKLDLLTSISNALKKINLPYNIDFLNFWYNIYHDDQGQEPHWHLPSAGNIMPYWSGIYYNKNCNPTVFHRDHGAHRTLNFSGIENSEIKDCSWIEYLPNIADGDILLFPPHVIHSVKLDSSRSHLMRLTFSFNLKLMF